MGPGKKHRLPFNSYVAKERLDKWHDSKKTKAKWHRQRKHLYAEAGIEETGEVEDRSSDKEEDRSSSEEDSFEAKLAFPVVKKKKETPKVVTFRPQVIVENLDAKTEAKKDRATRLIEREAQHGPVVSSRAKGCSKNQKDESLEAGEKTSKSSTASSSSRKQPEKELSSAKKRVVASEPLKRTQARYGKEYNLLAEKQREREAAVVARQQVEVDKKKAKKEHSKRRAIQGQLRSSRTKSGQLNMSNYLKAIMMRYKDKEAKSAVAKGDGK